MTDSTALLIEIGVATGVAPCDAIERITQWKALLRRQAQLMYQQARYREADEIANAIGEPRPSDHERGDL